MKGFVLKTEGREICAALSEGITSLLITNKDGVWKAELSGLDGEQVNHVWLRKELHPGDELTLTFDEMEAAQVDKPQEVKKEFDEQKMVEAYYRIKRELQEEGLLAE